MRRLLISLMVFACLLVALPAQAHQTTTSRQGKVTHDRSCSVGGGCQFTEYDNGDLKIHTESATARVMYKIPVPANHKDKDTWWFVTNPDACNNARAYLDISSAIITEDWVFIQVVVRFNSFNGIGNCRVVEVGLTWGH